MADGSSRADPSPQNAELFKMMMFDILKQVVESNRSEPQKDEKKPLKKKKEPNKKLEALKKKAAEEKAKLLKTRKELNALKILEKKERATKRLETRKSLIERDLEIIRSAEDKLRQPTEQ